MCRRAKQKLSPGTVALLPIDWTVLPVGGAFRPERTNHVITQLMTGSSGNAQPVGLGLPRSTNRLCSCPQNQSSVVYCCPAAEHILFLTDTQGYDVRYLGGTVKHWSIDHVIKQLMTGPSGNAQPVSQPDCAVALRTSHQLYTVVPAPNRSCF